jgi:glycosyltransferase involved in cell wall biosynthesis
MQPLESSSIPLVSVVIPAYNCGNYIGETLESVLKQDYPRLEVIVVDDGSTDNTKDVVVAFSSDRVRYVYQVNSGGPSGPRNTGIQHARGQFVAFLDADDIMLPGKLQCAVQLLERDPTLGLVFANFVKFDEVNGQHSGSFLDTYENFWRLPKTQVGDFQYVIKADVAYDGLIVENYIGTSGVVVPKKVLAQVGPFDLQLRGPEDYDMWLRIAFAYDIGYVDMIGHRYRLRTGGITGLGDVKLVPHLIRVMQKQLNKTLPDTTYKKVRRNLSRQFFAIGYCHQLNDEMAHARKCYMLSLREGNYWLSWKGLFLTLFGGDVIRFLKKVRGY